MRTVVTHTSAQVRTSTHIHKYTHTQTCARTHARNTYRYTHAHTHTHTDSHTHSWCGVCWELSGSMLVDFPPNRLRGWGNLDKCFMSCSKLCVCVYKRLSIVFVHETVRNVFWLLNNLCTCFVSCNFRFIYTHAHIYTHTHAHIYTHTHIHAHTLFLTGIKPPRALARMG